MKRNVLTLICLALATLFLAGCATTPKTTSAPLSFSPQQIAADEYVPKVENIVVILDASNSMNEAVGSQQKIDVAKAFLTSVNETLPEYDYNVELITFGAKNGIAGAGSLAKYSKSDFTAALAKVGEPSGNSSKPLTKAINAAAKDLQGAQGQNAVLIVGDGARLYKSPAVAATGLKEQFGDNVCIYTVQIGDNAQGAAAMQEIASAAACGSSTVATDLASASAMGGFVADAFLTQPPVVAAPVVLDSDGDGVLDADDECPNTPIGAHVNYKGCWAYDAEVMFAFDSSVINAAYQPMLDNGVHVMQQNPGLIVEVDGHTDNVGAAAYNQKLSEARALAVANYFVAHGISPDRLSAKGFGFTMPISTNDTESGRSQNRRVELKVQR